MVTNQFDDDDEEEYGGEEEDLMVSPLYIVVRSYGEMQGREEATVTQQGVLWRCTETRHLSVLLILRNYKTSSMRTITPSARCMR